MKQKIRLGDCYALTKHKLKKIKIRYISLLVVLTIMCLYARAQQLETFVVTGKVTSAASGAALANVTVTNLRNQVATRTNSSGEFTMNVLANDKLTFSLVAYDRIEQSIARQKQLSIKLQPSDGTLDEVVVIGYGKTSRRLNTGSVSSITAKDIEGQPVTNVLSALSGRMPGVFVQTANGLPGGNINIQIRGKGSIAAGTQPLYIIDGVPFDGSALWEGSLLASPSNSIIGGLSPLNMLNPADIESVSILKDADATSIYGSRGANGVVLITTKSYQKEHTGLEVQIQHGVTSIASSPSLLDLEQYLTIRREAFANEGRTPSGVPSSSDYAPDLMVWDTTAPTDWVEYFFGGRGNTTDIQLALTGGNSKTNYRLNNSMRRETTVLPGSNRYIRGSLGLNLSHHSDDGRFTLIFNNALSVDDHRTANPQGVSTSILLPPNYPIRNSDGTYNWYIQNPEASLAAKNRLKSSNVLANIAMRYDVVNSLTLKINAGYSRLANGQTQTFPTKALYPGTVNYSQFGDLANQSLVVEPQVEYRYAADRSNLTFLLGGTYQYRQGESRFLNASGFNNEGLMESIAAANSIVHRTNSFTQYKFISAFGRVTYALDNRYVLNATYRVDGSSRFGPHNRFGGFGAIGLAWLFADEDWFKSVLPLVSYGKLRASYGVVGNDQIADYLFMPTYRGSGFQYKGIAGLTPSRIANPDLKWETTGKFDGALEMVFFSDRLSVNVNYYLNRTRDQLVNYSLPRISGFSSYQANIPVVVENKGWELALQSTNLRRENLSWSTSINLTVPKNRLVSFENIQNSSYSRTLALGYDITRVAGYHLIEVDAQTGEPIFAGENGEPSPSPYAYHTLGKQTPDWYGGFGNTLSYRRWSVDVFLQFAKQMSLGGIRYTPGWRYNNYAVIYNRWQAPGDATMIPKPATRNNSRYSRSSANFFDASYLRLKSVSISYEVVTAKHSQKDIPRITAFWNGANLLTWWDRKSPILDPESGAMTISSANIPPMKTLVVGLRVSW